MFYWITVWILRVLFRSFTRLQVFGQKRVPAEGPFLLVSNHISHFDPLIYSIISSRSIDWMGSVVLFRNFVIRFLFRKYNVIKVRQYEADQSALREGIRRLRAGRGIGVFPEGGLRYGECSILGTQYKLYEGAFMMAVLSRAPILPCLIIGSDRLYNPKSLFRRPPIWVFMGEPILVRGEGREEIQRLKNETVKQIRQFADDLRAGKELKEDDWPKTPQERNSWIPPARGVRN